MSHHSGLSPQADEAVRQFIRRNKRTLRTLLLASLVVLLAGIALGGWALWRGSGAVTRWVWREIAAVGIPVAWERALGDSALAQLRMQVRFLTDARATEALDRLVAPLQQSPQLGGDRIKVLLVDSPVVNALALPGGYVAVFSGLVQQVNSAAELQGVIAHETAHVVKRDAVIQLASNLGLSLLLQHVLNGESPALERLVGASGQLLTLKFSRDQERAADDLAWDMLTAAGIDPGGLLGFFSRLAADEPAIGAGDSPLQSLYRTHPSSAERMQQLQTKPRPRFILTDAAAHDANLTALKRALE